MEIEYKWDLPDAALAKRLLAHPEVAGFLVSHEDIHMRATYYDTPDKAVRDMDGGLRIRQENDTTVCCLKLSEDGEDDCKTRREYEVAANEVTQGLRLLGETGAPADVCERLLAAELEATCETDFIRQAHVLDHGDFSAELAIDTGEMRREGRTARISEIELEYRDGSQDAFHSYALALQNGFGLEPQPLSKLARAANL